jgi:hypothetical protein
LFVPLTLCVQSDNIEIYQKGTEMKIVTIKQYSETYFVCFDHNGAQFNRPESQIMKDITRTASNEAHDRFVADTNKIRNIPTPKYEECKFNILNTEYTEEESKFRTYVVKVQVVWQYEKPQA